MDVTSHLRHYYLGLRGYASMLTTGLHWQARYSDVQQAGLTASQEHP
jgi:hypothetical protein